MPGSILELSINQSGGDFLPHSDNLIDRSATVSGSVDRKINGECPIANWMEIAALKPNLYLK